MSGSSALAHVRPGWMRLGAQGSACWFAQVRRFCGQCPWLSVRWGALNARVHGHIADSVGAANAER